MKVAEQFVSGPEGREGEPAVCPSPRSGGWLEVLGGPWLLAASPELCITWHSLVGVSLPKLPLFTGTPVILD